MAVIGGKIVGRSQVVVKRATSGRRANDSSSSTTPTFSKMLVHLVFLFRQSNKRKWNGNVYFCTARKPDKRVVFLTFQLTAAAYKKRYREKVGGTYKLEMNAYAGRMTLALCIFVCVVHGKMCNAQSFSHTIHMAPHSTPIQICVPYNLIRVLHKRRTLSKQKTIPALGFMHITCKTSLHSKSCLFAMGFSASVLVLKKPANSLMLEFKSTILFIQFLMKFSWKMISEKAGTP